MNEKHHAISIVSIDNHVPFCFALEVKPIVKAGSKYPIALSPSGAITINNKKVIPFEDVSLEPDIYLAKSVVHFIAQELQFSGAQNAFKKFKLALQQAAGLEITATFK